MRANRLWAWLKYVGAWRKLLNAERRLAEGGAG
jgi:hypothetical protein